MLNELRIFVGMRQFDLFESDVTRIVTSSKVTSKVVPK